MTTEVRQDTGELRGNDGPALAVTIRKMAAEGRVLDALGGYYLTAPCACGTYSQGSSGWAILHVDGVELHLCGDCGRPSNRHRLLPGPPFARGDLVVYLGMLWVLDSGPGPTGAVQAHPLDSSDTDRITLHVLQLNQED